jgi:hypothetical protein
MVTQRQLKFVLLFFSLILCNACGHSSSSSSSGSSGGPVALVGCETLHCASAPDNKSFYSNVSSKAFDRHR